MKQEDDEAGTPPERTPLETLQGDRLPEWERIQAEALYHAPVAVLLADPGGKIIYVNKYFLDLWGFDAPGDVIGRRADDFLWSPEQRRRESCALGENLQLVREWEAVRKDLRVLTVEVRVTPIRDSNGQVLYLQACFTDVTRRKQMEQEIVEAHNETALAHSVKRTFMAHVSHELRTPMNGILGFSSLLTEMELPPEAREYASMIHADACSLIGVINDILDVSNLESGELSIARVPFQLDDCIQDALDLIRSEASKKSLRLFVEITSGTPLLLIGDGVRLRQALANLLSNAVKFTAKGRITVTANSAERQDGRLDLTIAVKDTGIGIASDMMNHITKPFQQVDSSYARPYGGMGIGLYIVKELCQRMGGALSVQSTLGKGSVFSINIPVDRAHEVVHRFTDENPAELSAALDKHQTRPILLAEDEPSNQGVIKSMLQRIGYTCDLASNGLEALEAIRKKPYDLVIMDIQMPLMDGIEAIRHIYSEKLRRHARYITALTAHALQADRDACMQVGADEYLPKPISHDQLKQMLLRAFRRHRRHRAHDQETGKMEN